MQIRHFLTSDFEERRLHAAGFERPLNILIVGSVLVLK